MTQLCIKTSLTVVLAALLFTSSTGFTSPASSVISTHQYEAQNYRTPTKTELNSEKNDKTGLAPGVSKNLLTETIAPFRGLRLFFYGAFASGAFVGGLITLSGVAAALNGLRGDVDMNTEYLNLAIDFGAVALFGVLAKIDFDKGEELKKSVEQRIENKKKQKTIVKSMREREQRLAKLELDVRVSEDGETKRASVGIMQEKARQHIILVAGPGRVVRDALRGAQLNKVNFAMTNILVVPYQTGLDGAESASRPSGGGFADRPSYEKQPYVAVPVGDGWDEFIAEEMNTAVEQAGDKAMDEGIALVIANDGKVLRRGLGRVPWRQMVDELEEAVTGEKKETAIPFLEFME